MKKIVMFAIFALALVLYSTAVFAASYSLGDGRKLYNVVDDFIAYAEQHAGSGQAQRRTAWDAMLQDKYPRFFAEVIYRSLTGTDLANFKESIIQEFWTQVYPRLDTLKALNQDAPQKMLDARTAFKAQFPGFNPGSDYFLTISFSFHGKVVTYEDGTMVLAIGLEHFSPADPAQLDITIAHEHIHLHHFHSNRNFSTSGGLYRKIWAEGLAVYGSAVVMPGQRLRKYLGFSIEKMNQIYFLFYDLTDNLVTNIDSTDSAIVRAYIGAEENPLWIPSESGYYLGFIIIEELVRQGHSVEDMLTWSAGTVRGYMLTYLPRIDVLGGDSPQNCTYRFSGRVRDQSGAPLQGIAVRGLPGNPVTDAGGYYSTTVQCQETGQATPFKPRAAFAPDSRPFGPGSSLRHVSGMDFRETGSQDRSLLPGVLMLLLDEGQTR